MKAAVAMRMKHRIINGFTVGVYLDCIKQYLGKNVEFDGGIHSISLCCMNKTLMINAVCLHAIFNGATPPKKILRIHKQSLYSVDKI
jgi:hypothetical protein